MYKRQGLLQATSLPFLVAAATIGMEVGTISRTTGAALVCAGLLSVVLFPALAVSRLRVRDSSPADHPEILTRVSPTRREGGG